MVLWKKVVLASSLFSAGLGFGFTASLIIMIMDEPPVVYKEKWRTITTAPTPPVVLGHTSLNPDEIENILKIQAGLDTTTTTTTLVATTTTTRQVIVVTTMPPLPSTLPSSSTTLPPETTTTTAPTTTTSGAISSTTTSPVTVSSTTTSN